MNILLVAKLARSARAINTIAHYARIAGGLGHEIAVFGEQLMEFPEVRFSLDVAAFDVAVFLVYTPSDFPDLPYLANLLDGMPKRQRVIIDCTGRYNETIRVEHDFNHLEKMDGHQGWEWIDAFQSVGNLILQPTFSPRRHDVLPFLFHGFELDEVANSSQRDTAERWATQPKRYGVAYVGNNWQRWTQVRRFVEAIAPLRERLGPLALFGGDWKQRPEWAVQLGIKGADVDPELLDALGVERFDPIPYSDFRKCLSQARFSPIFQRPLFNELGLVSNRIFETFAADTMPLLLLPEPLVVSIYGQHATPLILGDDIAGQLEDMIRNPLPYWEAIARVRKHLFAHHSYHQRLSELTDLLQR
jgi:hypothetical protein